MRSASTRSTPSSRATTIRPNASMTLAGDIDPERALALVRSYFEEIPAGETVEPVRAEASLEGEVRILLEDRVELPRLYMAWLSPAMFAEGDADLDLAADVLANGKTSRLYRRLVFEERIATDVSASQNSREIGGYVQLAATAAPGHTLGELERVILEEIERLGTSGPTDDEIDRGPRPGGSAVRLQAADGRRLRRQIGSAERLQRLPAATRPISTAIFQRYFAVTNRVSPADGPPLSRSGPAGDAQHRAARPHRAGGPDSVPGGGRLVTHRSITASRTRAVGRDQLSRRSKSRRCRTALRVWTVRHAQVPVVAFSLLDPPRRLERPARRNTDWPR